MKPRTTILPALAAASLILASCSSVFTASLSGRLVDREIHEADDGRDASIAEATVYLYMEESERAADLSAWDGTDATLPDGPGNGFKWFACTTSGVEGDFQFTGIIWENLFPEFGKTADRKEVFLLFHHPRYGLVPNAVPVYVLSDSTYRAGIIRLEDRYNTRVLSGRLVDWQDGKGIDGRSVAVYVPEEWTYSEPASIDPASIRWKTMPSHTSTTMDGGYWSVEISFPRMPAVGADGGIAPVRVAFPGDTHRANPDATIQTEGAVVSGTVDLDRDGRTYVSGDDFDDAALELEVAKEDPDAPAPYTTGTVVLQRWRFSKQLAGRVKDASEAAFVNGRTVSILFVYSTTSFTDTTAPIQSGDIALDGRFDFGTLAWTLDDDIDPAASEADRKAGRLPVSLTVNGSVPDSGAPNFLDLAGGDTFLELVVP
ncbi:MAG: hypothetical protein JXA15_03895 [Spirochaetales bacterium]|nr:hypothetical protein [Spirochaetales bacterium]